MTVERLAELAAGRGDADTLTYLIDAGNGLAADCLAEVAAAHSEVDPLYRLVDDGSGLARCRVDRARRPGAAGDVQGSVALGGWVGRRRCRTGQSR